MTKRIEFIGVTDALPKREKKDGVANEHDILRAILLAEDFPGRWVEFRCFDKMHAIKFAHVFRKYEFNADITARGDRVFVRFEL